jgi:hypothetical protein
MEEENKRIIEINGIKMEVDLRTAKIVENYKVGDTCKVLRKNYSDYDVSPGVIISFTEFKKLPTIELIVVDRYGKLEYINYNDETKDVEIAPYNKYEVMFDFDSVVEKMDKDIETKEIELMQVKYKKELFIKEFKKSFNKEFVAKEN